MEEEYRVSSEGAQKLQCWLQHGVLYDFGLIDCLGFTV